MSSIVQELRSIPVGDLSPHHKNARRGDVKAIAASLSKTGQYRPLVVNEGTLTGRPFEVLAGNHTLAAAKSLGWSEVDVTIVDVDDETATRILLADNRTADLGEYDDEALVQLLEDLDELDGTGYTGDDLAGLLARVRPVPEFTEEEADVIPADAPSRTTEGDVWQLGAHRLICGDASSPEVLRCLMAGDTAHVIWTDPPYGVDYVGGTGEKLTIRNDTRDGLEELLTGAFRTAAAFSRPGAPTYVAHADTRRKEFDSALEAAGIRIRQHLVWVKSSFVLGRSDYQPQHEPILEAVTHEPIQYGFTAGGSGRLGRGGAHWFGGNNASTVFEVPKPAASREHPTMKPVALIEAMLTNSLGAGQLVLDMFAGSGSTLFAAERLGAAARLVELEPHYCDVIVARWEQVTGGQAVKL